MYKQRIKEAKQLNKLQIIDFLNSDTFPSNLLKLVSDFYNANTEIKKTLLESPHCLADNIIFNRYYFAQNVLKGIEKEIADKTFALYHATRIDNADTILQLGIKCFEKNEYIKYIETVLRVKGVCYFRRKKAIKHLKKTQSDKYCFSLKQNVCFFSNYTGDDTFYTEYCKNIGGELALSAFQDDFPQIFSLLQSGKPVIVKFESDYASFSSCTKECICKQFFRWASAKCLGFGEQTIEVDGEIEKNITPEHIIDTFLIENDAITYTASRL